MWSERFGSGPAASNKDISSNDRGKVIFILKEGVELGFKGKFLFIFMRKLLNTFCDDFHLREQSSM